MLISRSGKSEKFFEFSCHDFGFWYSLCKGFTQDLAKMAILEGDATSIFFRSNQRVNDHSNHMKMCPMVIEKFPLLQNINIYLHFFKMSISNFLTREIRGVKTEVNFLAIVQLPPPLTSSSFSVH